MGLPEDDIAKDRVYVGAFLVGAMIGLLFLGLRNILFNML
jgi:hypothetical protein